MLNDIYESSSNWLKAADLKGTKPIVTIAAAEVKENVYDGQRKRQIVLTFAGKEKQLGLNFTNASMIAALTGTEDFNEWIGVSIRLYEDKTKTSNGAIVPCIRIFPDLPNTNGTAPKHPPVETVKYADDDSIPF